MKKLLIVVVICALLGGGAYFVMNKGVLDTTEEGSKVSVRKEESGDKPFTGTLKAAVALGVPMKCTYEVEGMKYEGVIKGKKYKGAIKMPDGKEGNVIMIDNCMYTWTNEESQGIKMCFEEEDGDIWEQSEGNMPGTYKCKPAAVLDSAFDLPKNVEFMDLETMMQGIGLE